MSQQSTHPLQHLMQDLQLRQHKLGEQMAAFQALQQEIADLKTKAPHDPEAQQRLERLSRAMQQELRPLREQLGECMGRLQTHFTSLEASLKQPDSGSPAGTTAKAAPSLGRRFI